MLIIIGKSKEMLFLALRIIILLLMVSLFIPKVMVFLASGGQDGEIFSKDEHPTGNPRRVEQSTFGQNAHSDLDGFFDGMVQKLQEFYRKDR